MDQDDAYEAAHQQQLEQQQMEEEAMKELFAAFVKAQGNNSTPEGRMAEAAALKRLADSGLQRKKTTRGRSDQSRFLQSVAMGASTCWYWNGYIDDLGYGRTTVASENKAHRASYRIFKGDIPAGAKVLHSCDTRCCVNPEHLRLGTQAENIADMIGRGRQKSSPRHGEDNPMAKASWDVVKAIREAVSAGAKQVDMAKRYGLSPMTVSRIVRKESWQ